MSVPELSFGGVQCQLPELSLSLPELSFRESSVFGSRDMFDLIEYQLVQLVEIQRESLV